MTTTYAPNYNYNSLPLPSAQRFGIAEDDLMEARCGECGDSFEFHGEQHLVKTVACAAELVVPELCQDCEDKEIS